MKIGNWRSESDNIFFIAEAGVNHNGDLETAKELVDVAVDSNADAVKFQTFQANSLVTETAPTADYQYDGTGRGTQRELLSELELEWSEHVELKAYCEKKSIMFLSTPFGIRTASLLEELGVDAFKVGSGDLTNHPLLKHISSFGSPMIVSTGMSTLDEVRDAYTAIRNKNVELPIVLLHCVSAYPTPMNEANLRAIQTLDDTFPSPIGFSDHTTAVETPALAVASGAQVVEKHFTLDRGLSGPDHAASLEPPELDRAVSLVRDAASALGDGEKTPMPSERETRSVARKGIYAAVDLEPGTKLTEENTAIKRPEEGLSPFDYERVLGRTISKGLSTDEPISEDYLIDE